MREDGGTPSEWSWEEGEGGREGGRTYGGGQMNGEPLQITHVVVGLPRSITHSAMQDSSIIAAVLSRLGGGKNRLEEGLMKGRRKA